MKRPGLCSKLTYTSQKLYNSFSKSLLSTTSLKDLQKLHSLIIAFGLHKSLFLSGTLISKYSKFGDHGSSFSVFQANSFRKNTFVWNTVIRAMTNNGLFAKALDLYVEMRKFEVKQDNYTFPSVIKACGSLMDAEKGRFVHRDALELGFGSDLYVNNSLIDMYARCNELVCAQEVFDEMPERDVISWNSLISGYSSNGYFGEALEVYRRSRIEGLVPDSITFSSTLQACGGVGEVKEGKIVHGLVQKSGASRDVTVNNGLLSMYFKFDLVVDCWRIFNDMVDRDAFTWNIMIVGCFESGLYEESIKLLLEMVSYFKPDILTITYVLRACTNIRDLNLGKYVHNYMISNGYECDTLSYNILLNMYAKCGDLVHSREVFESMGSKDLVSWNSLLNGYIEYQLYEEATELFRKMETNGEQPDPVTYVALLSICKDLMNINFTEELHCAIIKQGFESAQILGNALVDAYAKCGQIGNSLKQFENMKIRDIFTWNSIIAACVHWENSIGFQMLHRMRMDGFMPDVPTFLSALPLCSRLAAKRQGKELHSSILRLGFESNVPIANSLIEMYSNTGSLGNSVLLFDQMKERDIVSWTSLISAYGTYGEGKKALEAFEDMKAAGIHPDETVFVAIIYACSHSGLVQEGQSCFEEMKKVYKIEPSIEHYAATADLLSRAGLLAKAEEFINTMPYQPDVSIWGALLSACQASGDLEIAGRVSKRIAEFNTEGPGYQVLASNAYAALGKWDQVSRIRTSLKNEGLHKDPGCSWLEV